MREIISNKDQKRSYTGNLSVYQIYQEIEVFRNEVEKQRGRSTGNKELKSEKLRE